MWCALCGTTQQSNEEEKEKGYDPDRLQRTVMKKKLRERRKAIISGGIREEGAGPPSARLDFTCVRVCDSPGYVLEALEHVMAQIA